jgi:nitroreductase
MHPLISGRWSPRWLDPDGVVGDEALRSMLEAARWAPSSGNTQPARYLVGRRGDSTYERIFDVLSRRNQSWAHAAGALLLAVAVTSNEKGEIPYAEYGLGLATENLVLQAVAEGLVAHQMAGFNAEAARILFDLPPNARPVVVVAVGVLGDRATVPEEMQARELGSRKRRPLSEIAFTDSWDNPAFPS